MSILPNDLFGKVILGDCFSTMLQLPDRCVDLVLTSPPYLDSEVPEYTDGEVSSNYYNFLDMVVWQSIRIAPVLLLFNSSRRLPDICRRYPIAHVLIWDKMFTLPAFKYEPIFVITDLPIFGPGRIYRDCLRYMVPRNKVHINQNLVELYEELLRFFPRANSVYDPFMGSGTTARACIRQRRQWFGNEKVEGNVKIANELIAEEKEKRYD